MNFEDKISFISKLTITKYVSLPVSTRMERYHLRQSSVQGGSRHCVTEMIMLQMREWQHPKVI